MLVDTYSPSTWEANIGESSLLSSRLHSGFKVSLNKLHSKTLSQTNKGTKTMA